MPRFQPSSACVALHQSSQTSTVLRLPGSLLCVDCVWTLCVSVGGIHPTINHFGTISPGLLARTRRVGTIVRCITNAIKQESGTFILKGSIPPDKPPRRHASLASPGQFPCHPCCVRLRSFESDLPGLDLDFDFDFDFDFETGLHGSPRHCPHYLSLPFTYLGNLLPRYFLVGTWSAWSMKTGPQSTIHTLPQSIFPTDVVAPPFPCLLAALPW